jgi:[ribosomal protein S18]-alanine N-acetyltransferase
MLDWLSRSPPTIAIEPLDTDHAGRLAVLHRDAFARPWSAIDFERMLADRAILGDGLFVGRASLLQGFCLSRIVADEAEILTIAVAAALRGRGHSRALLDRHLEALRRRGVATLHLEVDEGNAPATALYRRFGFAVSGRREGYYLKRDGSRATALMMTLAL